MSDAKYDVKPLQADDYELWDSQVEETEQGTLFHQTHWLSAFDSPFTVIGCYDNDNLIGGMALSHQQLASLTIARPPYLTPYWGPLVFRDQGKYHTLLTLKKDVALSLIDYLMATYSFVRTPLPPGHLDAQPFQQNGFQIEVEYTYVIELDDSDRVWQEMNQGNRRKIKKGYKEGLSCQTSEDPDTFFPLWTRSLSSHDKQTPQERIAEVRRWYNALRARNRAAYLQIRDSQDRVCAGAVLVWDHRRAYYLLSGMNREIAGYNAMPLLVWECIRYCREDVGAELFDFDGSDVPSVEIFFRGFGGRLTPRLSATWSRPLIRPLRRIWKLVDGAG